MSIKCNSCDQGVDLSVSFLLWLGSRTVSHNSMNKTGWFPAISTSFAMIPAVSTSFAALSLSDVAGNSIICSLSSSPLQCRFSNISHKVLQVPPSFPLPLPLMSHDETDRSNAQGTSPRPETARWSLTDLLVCHPQGTLVVVLLM